jgi:hypothetical protein
MPSAVEGQKKQGGHVHGASLKVLVVLLGSTLVPGVVYGQASRNLEVCLSGKYPALCDHNALTPEQLQEARRAEKQQNLQVCMTGKYPALCDHSMLSPEETVAVRRAERVENLKVCESGKYPALCNHGLLSPDELKQVQDAERAENLKVCMDGRYPALCNHSFLTADQARLVASAEAKVASNRPKAPAPRPLAGQSGGCDSGHWIQSVEGDGKIIKLENGSMWEVDDIDTATTSIWLPVSEIIVCGNKIINVDDNESAAVTPIHGGEDTRVPQSRRSTYVIQASADDETFVINGQVFQAKTYCFDFDKGDRVIFLEGSPQGACASAKMLNLRTEKVCDCWCE